MADRAHRWVGGLLSRRYRYMTARGPLGCDWWSIPPAVDRHFRSGKCKRRPWALGGGGELLIAGDDYARAGVLALVPAQPKRPATLGDRAARPLARDRIVRDAVGAGTVLTSRFPGIPARRWLEVADAALRRIGPAVMAEVLDHGRFAEREQTLGTAEGFVSCPLGGDWLQEGGLIGHQRSSTRCPLLVAHREVEAAWAQGWRDPWSFATTCARGLRRLSRGRWRSRIRTVEYPQSVGATRDPLTKCSRGGWRCLHHLHPGMR